MATDDPMMSRLADLPARGKEPANARVLDGWIASAQRDVDVDGGRLGWLIATTVVTAALQRTLGAEPGAPAFLLKGGTYLQHRLGASSRPTKDLDGIIRGDIDVFLARLDEQLATPWPPFELRRERLVVIDTPTRVVKPRRFDVVLSIRGKVWRRVQVEISPDEGRATDEADLLPAPSLEHFGLPTPDELLGIALRYQIAQKLHACSDPHDPPTVINDRPRDVVDLLALRRLVDEGPVGDGPSLALLRSACVDVFEARAQDAVSLGLKPRQWPCTVTAHAHWGNDFAAAARSAGLPDLRLADAVGQVNAWIGEIDRA